MPRPRTELTGDQVRGLYEYRVVKRLLKDEFPFIKDVNVEDDKINEYNLVFLSIEVDPFELAEYYDSKPYWGLVYQKINNPDYAFNAPFLATFLQNPPPRLSAIFDNEADDIIETVSNSTVIPNHMKLPEDRSFKLGNIRTTKDFTIPQDYKEEFINNHPELKYIPKR